MASRGQDTISRLNGSSVTWSPAIRGGQGDQFGGQLDAGAVRLSPVTKASAAACGHRRASGAPSRPVTYTIGRDAARGCTGLSDL
jgi:hypothetical protein